MSFITAAVSHSESGGARVTTLRRAGSSLEVRSVNRRLRYDRSRLRAERDRGHSFPHAPRPDFQIRLWRLFRHTQFSDRTDAHSVPLWILRLFRHTRNVVSGHRHRCARRFYSQRIVHSTSLAQMLQLIKIVGWPLFVIVSGWWPSRPLGARPGASPTSPTDERADFGCHILQLDSRSRKHSDSEPVEKCCDLQCRGPAGNLGCRSAEDLKPLALQQPEHGGLDYEQQECED